MYNLLRIISLTSTVLIQGACCKLVTGDGCTTVDIEFKVDTPSTKAGDTPTDNGIRSLDVLAFRHGSGLLEAVSRSSGNTVSVPVSKGVELDFRLVANANGGRFDDIWTLDGFDSGECRMEENAAGYPVMTGRISGTFARPAIREVPMKRLLCKVSVGTVSPMFMDLPGFSTARAVLKGIYLINANGTCFFDGSASESSRLCLSGWDSNLSERTEEMLGSRDIDIPVSNSSPIDCKRVMYLFPCVSPDSPTRLVIEFTIDGIGQYHTITLPPMSGNTHYMVNDIRLTGPGAKTPDTEMDGSAAYFQISIQQWNSGDFDIML